MQPVEGYLIESVEGVIFDVKGLVHPLDKIIAFPRFIPNFEGPRQREKEAFKKIYSLKERFDFLERVHPAYAVYDRVFDEKLCEVPLGRVKKVYNPIQHLERLRKGGNLDELEAAALHCLKILKEEAVVPWNCLGISGSLLVGLHCAKSDIDPVVYGVENCRKVHGALRKLLADGGTPFRRYSLEDLKVLYDFRSRDTAMNFEDFVAVESRKVFQGKFLDKDFFIRFVKTPNEAGEKYGEIQYRNVGYARIEAVVVDDSEAIFTPCKYKIEEAKVIEGPSLQPIKEIASFRGRFCEQARKGERVVAKGKIEHVKDGKKSEEYYRLLIGNKPEDHIILNYN